MLEIAPCVYIESAYSGVTLGAIAWENNLILIDAPLKPDDTRLWRSSLSSISHSVERLLINLDAHIDRTLGARAMECTIMGHEAVAEVFRSRPLTFKAQSVDSGAEWEQCEGISNTRWASPDIVFNQELFFHQENSIIHLEKCPGVGIGSICVQMPVEKVIFIGDMVTPNQPPFLADADLPAWMSCLNRLLTTPFKDYKIVSGRGGLIQPGDVKDQLKYLQKVEKVINNLVKKDHLPENLDSYVNNLLTDFSMPAGRKNHFIKRLEYGIKQYFFHHFISSSPDNLPESI